MTVAEIAQCGYCGAAYRDRDETTTTEIEGYPVVVEAGECPYCATPTTHPETATLAGGQQ